MSQSEWGCAQDSEWVGCINRYEENPKATTTITTPRYRTYLGPKTEAKVRNPKEKPKSAGTVPIKKESITIRPIEISPVAKDMA
ncbi:hypothetical protein LPTSP4_34170 [Leptospira ryugenii]|uniref:Uncharacterized protein n=1 Tax=Leptospira ryugenii TaxID=1917863 RepID=A0A2P2E4S1_9LEPT|nr:hypothetical protein LPTSP4_34170 [Leptospira ryugenii]